jgi:hypothetical protein
MASAWGNDGRSALNVGGIATALGSVGVAITTLFYALSPPAAAMPHQPLDLAGALAGAVAGATMMGAASTVGILFDIALAAGALLVAFEFARLGRGVAAAGWAMMFVSVLLFTFVDVIVGQVLVPLAAAHGESMAFLGFKVLFDALFLLGTVAFGSGLVLAMAAECSAGTPLVAKSLAYAGIIIGILGIAAAAACFVHLPLELAVGASIGLGSVLFIAIGIQLAKADANPSARSIST